MNNSEKKLNIFRFGRFAFILPIILFSRNNISLAMLIFYSLFYAICWIMSVVSFIFCHKTYTRNGNWAGRRTNIALAAGVILLGVVCPALLLLFFNNFRIAI